MLFLSSSLLLLDFFNNNIESLYFQVNSERTECSPCSNWFDKAEKGECSVDLAKLLVFGCSSAVAVLATLVLAVGVIQFLKYRTRSRYAALSSSSNSSSSSSGMERASIFMPFNSFTSYFSTTHYHPLEQCKKYEL